MSKRPIEYSTGFTLLPGRYSIKFLARDDETGRIGTYQTSFVIPNLNKETKRLAISSVVLSNQRVDPKAALYNPMKGKDQAKNDAVNPLVNAQGKLIPSVTRVFRADRDLEILLQAYQGILPADRTAPRSPIIAYVTFLHDGKKSMETQAVKVEPLTEDRLGTTPITMKVSIAGLALGEYYTQVTVLDPGSNRLATWRGRWR